MNLNRLHVQGKLPARCTIYSSKKLLIWVCLFLSRGASSVFFSELCLPPIGAGEVPG